AFSFPGKFESDSALPITVTSLRRLRQKCCQTQLPKYSSTANSISFLYGMRTSISVDSSATALANKWRGRMELGKVLF
ncbi:hypothetical protein NPIL_623581, partial [Nephila pilipes]